MGTGNCYFKGGTTYSTNTAGSNTYVGGIRVLAGGVSTASSATASPTRIGSGTPSGFPATCPTDNLKNITDTYGVSYQVRCQCDIAPVGGGGTAAGAASSTFNDCFLLCDTTLLNNGGQCTGFTYVGAANGAGSGTCYLKGGVTYTNSTPADNNILAGIRLADAGAASLSSFTRTTTTTTTTSSSSSAPATTTTTTTSTTTTTTTSSSAAASSPLSTYSCPANDGQVVTDSGIQYQFRCGFQAQPVSGAGSYATQTGQTSLNPCLRACSANSIEDRNNPGTFPICSGFTFSVTNTADGSGSCIYRSQNPLTFGSPNQYFTGLVKVQYYQPPVVTTTTTSTTTTSSSTSTSVLNPMPSYTCPDYDQEARAFGGRTYIMGCSASLYPAPAFSQQAAPNNWNDCFGLCNNLSGCTGFTYTGGVNGVGPGTCYFSNAARSGFITTNNTQAAGTLYNTADQYLGYVVLTTTTTTTSSSVQTLTLTTVSYATVTTTSSYAITTTAISTQFQTVTTSYPVTQTQVSTAPGKC